MKNFYLQVINSVYSKDFYKSLDNKDTSYTITYLLKFSLVLGLIFAALSTILLISLKNQIISSQGVDNLGDIFASYVETNFADDLVVTFKDGHVSTNSSEPVKFPTPTEWLEIENSESSMLPENLLVISENEEFNNELLDQYDSFAVFASSSVGFVDDNERVQVVDYSDFSEEVNNLEINKELALEKTREFSEVIENAVPYILLSLFVILFIFAAIFIFVGNLVFAVFTGFVAFLLGKIVKSKKTFGNWYLKAIHANTFYTLLIFLGGWFVPFLFVPFLNTMTVIVILFLNDSFKE